MKNNHHACMLNIISDVATCLSAMKTPSHRATYSQSMYSVGVHVKIDCYQCTHIVTVTKGVGLRL